MKELLSIYSENFETSTLKILRTKKIKKFENQKKHLFITLIFIR